MGKTQERAGSAGGGRALFLDRDGVINEEIGYVARQEEVRFVAGIFELCRAARGLDYRLIVVTNQAGIARGYYTEDDFNALTEWMRGEFEREGCPLDAVYYCPFHPEQGVGAYKCESIDRKPGPGMLLRGAAEFGLDLSSCWFVGDRCSDVGAGTAAGMGRMLLLEGTEAENVGCDGRYERVKTLEEVRLLLLKENAPAGD